MKSLKAEEGERERINQQHWRRKEFFNHFLAKKSNIHIQAICQANRATKENDDGYARTENLADSDQYGRDAFVVYSIKTSLGSDKYSINPTKNRNGKPEEEIELTWNAKSGRIAQDQYLTSNYI